MPGGMLRNPDTSGAAVWPPRFVAPRVGAVAQIGSSGPRKASVPVASVTLKPPVEFR
jgi:hypothetical protein